MDIVSTDKIKPADRVEKKDLTKDKKKRGIVESAVLKEAHRKGSHNAGVHELPGGAGW